MKNMFRDYTEEIGQHEHPRNGHMQQEPNGILHSFQLLTHCEARCPPIQWPLKQRHCLTALG